MAEDKPNIINLGERQALHRKIVPFPNERKQEIGSILEERELARKSGENLVLSYSLGAPFGLFDWIETKYSSSDVRDEYIRDGLFQGAARILANRALGYNDETNRDPNNDDLELFGEEFDAQYNYLEKLFTIREKIPHKTYKRGILPEPEATYLKNVIDSIKFEPETTREAYLSKKAREFALVHLGISEEQIEITPEFEEWLQYEKGHLHEMVIFTNAKSIHGAKEIETAGE